MAETAPAVLETPLSELAQWKEARKTGGSPVETPVAVAETPPAEPVDTPEPVTPEIPAQSRWEDPDTNEQLDLNTRRGKRIKRLWSEREAAKTEAATLRAQLAQRAGAPEPASPPTPAVPAAPTGKPNINDFADYNEYVEAVTDWKVEEKLKARDAAVERTQASRSEAQILESFKAKLPEVRQTYADFDAVMANIPITPQTHYLIERVILPSPNGPDLAYHLGSHPEALQRLLHAPSFDAHLRELGKLEAEVEALVKARATPVEPSPSNLPPPIRPITGGAPAVTPDVSRMSLSDWKERRKKLGL